MIRVIKLGGSLLESEVLAACLDRVESVSMRTLVVPGGGAFAEQVRIEQRRLGFGDVAAHRMAILAMAQMALLFNALKPDFPLFSDLADIARLPRVAIWSPDWADLDRAGVESSWDLTSDSLAAWLAGQVDADELIVVKAAPVASDASLEQLTQQGIIDRGFRRVAASARYKISVINQHRFISTA